MSHDCLWKMVCSLENGQHWKGVVWAARAWLAIWQKNRIAFIHWSRQGGMVSAMPCGHQRNKPAWNPNECFCMCARVILFFSTGSLKPLKVGGGQERSELRNAAGSMKGQLINWFSTCPDKYLISELRLSSQWSGSMERRRVCLTEADRRKSSGCVVVICIRRR